MQTTKSDFAQSMQHKYKFRKKEKIPYLEENG